ASSLRKNKMQLRKHKVVHFMHPKNRSHNGYLSATELRETTQKHSFGPKEVDWASSLRKNKTQLRKHKVVHFMHPKTRSHNGYLPATESRETTQKLSFGPKEVDSARSLRKNKTQLRKHRVVHFMQPKTRSYNLYLPATESRETTQKLSFGPKQVDWACSFRKTRRNFGSIKWCIVCTPKPDLTTCTSRQRNRAKPPRNLVLGVNKWIGHVRCEKTRRIFGSIKWCIVCTPKPDLTTGTSRQRNRAKPPRNLVLGLKKLIRHVRCEKTSRNFGSTKWCILCTPKPDLTTCTSRQWNRAKPPRNLVLGLKKWIGHVRCEKTRRNFGSTKWCIVCTPKPDLTTGSSRQRNHGRPPRKLVLGLKKWIGQVRCEKTKRNFGSTKWCILCTPKPDLTTGTSRQRNRA